MAKQSMWLWCADHPERNCLLVPVIGVFSRGMKEAVRCPLHKNISLDLLVLDNYSLPVEGSWEGGSGASPDFLDEATILDPFQSGFCLIPHRWPSKTSGSRQVGAASWCFTSQQALTWWAMTFWSTTSLTWKYRGLQWLFSFLQFLGHRVVFKEELSQWLE